MAKKKKKSWGKKLATAAALAAAAYGASKLGRRGKKVFPETENLTHQVGPYIGDVGSERKNIYKFDTDHLTTPSLAAKGGRIGVRGGGIAKRGMGAAYKRGGRVKSMGIAKRGGGVAKR